MTDWNAAMPLLTKSRRRLAAAMAAGIAGCVGLWFIVSGVGDDRKEVDAVERTPAPPPNEPVAVAPAFAAAQSRDSAHVPLRDARPMEAASPPPATQVPADTGPSRSETRIAGGSTGDGVIVVTLEGSPSRAVQNLEERREPAPAAAAPTHAPAVAEPPPSVPVPVPAPRAHAVVKGPEAAEGDRGDGAPHGADAVVVEPDCGTVQAGRYVEPPPPHDARVCTVKEVVDGIVRTTTYEIDAAP